MEWSDNRSDIYRVIFMAMCYDIPDSAWMVRGPVVALALTCQGEERGVNVCFIPPSTIMATKSTMY